MFKRPTKKTLIIRRTITLTIMSLAVVVIVAGIILFILGYRLDGDKGVLEQGALVQFDSTPNGAIVNIDGMSIGSRTPAKQSIVAGAHDFTVTRANYETWSKSLTVKAGTLTWLDYIRLVPKALKTESVATYGGIYGEKASPDSKWIMIQERAEQPTFQLVDLRAQQIKSSTISLPESLYSEATTAGVTHTFTMNSWDQDGRYVLVRHDYADKSEYIVIDTQNAETSINVTRLLDIPLTNVKFYGTSGNILYGLSDGMIRKLDLSNATISRALVSNVKSFDIFETDVITYVGTDPAEATHQVAGLYREGDEAPHVLRVVNSLTTPLTIDAVRYYNDDYVAISEGSSVTILKGRYPSSSDQDSASLKPFADFMVEGAIDTTAFSPSGDFLVVQSGLRYVSYEVEYNRMIESTVATSETRAHTLNWLDDAYLWAIYDGHLSIREFDGTNTHVIMQMEPGFDATLSQNDKYLYGIGKSGDTYQLQRVKMILD